MPNNPSFNRKYSDVERDAFFQCLKRNEGNVRKAAIDSHIAIGTARYWLKVVRSEDIGDPELVEIIRRWKGTVDDKIDKTLYAIFDTINRKMTRASLPDLTKAARELMALKKSLQGKAGAAINPDEDDTKLALEDRALRAIQSAERRRQAATRELPPVGEKIEEVAGE